MTEVLSFDRPNGLAKTLPAKYTLLMQGSSYEKERAGAKADLESQTPSRSNRTTTTATYQRDRPSEEYKERRTGSPRVQD